VQIVGSEKALAQIDQLVTRPVSVKDISESFKKEIAVDLPSGVKISGTGTSLVTANVSIEENVIVRRFEAVPVESRNTVLPVKITPPSIDIDVRGPENTLSSLSVGDDIKAYIDLEGLAPGIYARSVSIPLNLPVGTTVAGYDPKVFTVTIGN
jgi:YbbR domain-containing protein